MYNLTFAGVDGQVTCTTFLHAYSYGCFSLDFHHHLSMIITNQVNDLHMPKKTRTKSLILLSNA